MTWWSNLSPTDRIDVLRDRIARRRDGKRYTPSAKVPKKPKKHVIDWKRIRLRQTVLAIEKADWLRLINECSGVVGKISEQMGYSATYAKTAIWDLGLWPNLVAANGAYQRRVSK